MTIKPEPKRLMYYKLLKRLICCTGLDGKWWFIYLEDVLAKRWWWWAQIVDSLILCYCLQTLVLNPLTLRMWPADSLYEIFRPEHWSWDVNTLLTMRWIPDFRHWTSVAHNRRIAWSVVLQSPSWTWRGHSHWC